MKDVSWGDVYRGAVLRVALCKECGHHEIIAYDDEALKDDFKVRHPDHEVYRISSGDRMCPWYVNEDGEVGVLLVEDNAIIRIGAVGAVEKVKL